MATTAAPTFAAHTDYAVGEGWRSWLGTTDHKKIGYLYFFTALFFLMFGGAEAEMIRWQLRAPNQHFLSAETYNQIFTMHGTTMIFLVVMPMSAAFFNLLIPLQIGARDVAFPRLNAFSYWVYLLGAIFISAPIFFNAAPNGGWFGYAPLTTTTYSPGLNIDFWAIGLQILGISSLAAGFNFITTIINMRAPGMNLMRMPMFTWMAFVVQFLIILAFPVITIAVVFLVFDRFFGTNFYEIAAGADPLLWQHLFWVFGHPEVYILVLPAFGLVSEVLPTFSRKPLFGYPVMVYSGILIGCARLRRVGTPHVRRRHGAHRRYSVRRHHDADRDSDRREDLQLDLHDVGRFDPLHDGVNVRDRSRRHVHDRRDLGDHALLPASRPAADGYLLHRRPLPLCALRRVPHGTLRRHLLLLPEAHRTHAR